MSLSNSSLRNSHEMVLWGFQIILISTHDFPVSQATFRYILEQSSYLQKPEGLEILEAIGAVGT